MRSDLVPDAVLIQIRRMWLDEGMSVNEIGRSLDPPRTRNSVIGIIHRNGWRRASDAKPISVAVSGTGKRRGRPDKRNVPNSLRHLPVSLPPVEDPIAKRSVARGDAANIAKRGREETRTPFHELTLFQCRWPEDGVEPAWNMSCCGDQVMRPGSSYCEEHFRAAYQRVGMRRDAGKPFW